LTESEESKTLKRRKKNVKRNGPGLTKAEVERKCNYGHAEGGGYLSHDTA